MESKKYTVFLTGATGVMGQAVVMELSHHLDLVNLRLLLHKRAIPNSISSIIKNNKNSIELINGDLRNYGAFRRIPRRQYSKRTTGNVTFS